MIKEIKVKGKKYTVGIARYADYTDKNNLQYHIGQEVYVDNIEMLKHKGKYIAILEVDLERKYCVLAELEKGNYIPGSYCVAAIRPYFLKK